MDPKEQSSQGHSRFEWGLPQVMQRAGRLSALREISAQGHRTEKARGLRQPKIPGTLRTKTIMKTKLITTALATVLAITCAYSQDSMKTAPASDALLRPDRCAQQQDLQDTGFRAGQLDDSAREILPIRYPPNTEDYENTLYNEHHFFHPNDLRRYSLGKKNLKRSADGSFLPRRLLTPQVTEF